MKNKVFIVNNEFHLLIFLKKYFECNEEEKENLKLIITKQPQSRRLDFEILKIPVEYLLIEDRFSEFTIKDRSIDFFHLIDEHCNHDIQQLNVFHDALFLNTLIINTYKKKYRQGFVNLIHEGIAGYYKRKIYIKHTVRYAIKYLYFKYYLGYSAINFVLNWGMNNNIDQMEMIFPDKVYNPKKLPIIKLNMNLDGELLTKIKTTFSFDELVSSELPNNKVALILSLGKSNRTYDLKQKEVELIKKVIFILKNKGYTPILKIKANEIKEDFAEFMNKEIVVTSSFPAELISLSLTDSIILSWNSSVNLINNSNKSFWLYPLLGMKKIASAPNNTTTIEFSDQLKLI